MLDRQTLTVGMILLFLLALPMPGQVRSATITGRVTDAAGALVPDASVTVLNQGTNASLEVRSNTSGEYSAPHLQAGKYTVLVRKDGFQPYRKTDVQLGAAQTVRVDAALNMGKVSVEGETGVNEPISRDETAAGHGLVHAGRDVAPDREWPPGSGARRRITSPPALRGL